MIRHTFAALACLIVAAFAADALAEDDAPQWKHDVIVTAPGTKSEGRTGVLTYGDQTIPPYFTLVVTPIGHFNYRVRTARWGQAGWMVMLGKVAPPERLDEAATDEELERGWYACDNGKIKPGTPGHWFYAPGLGTWVDPLKLDAFVKAHFSKADWTFTVKQNDMGFVTTALAYKNTPIPESVGAIITPIGEFHVPSVMAGPPAGWRVRSNKCVEIPAGDNALDDATIAKGVFDEDPKLTNVAIPEHWVYLPDKHWWIDPAKIGEHFKAMGGIAPIRTKIRPKGQ